MEKSSYRVHTLIFGLLLLLAAGLLAFGYFYAPTGAYVPQDGALNMSGYQRFDRRMVYLDQGWEYFPDQLIVSEKVEDPQPAGTVSLPGGLGTNSLPAPESGRASFRLTLTDVPERANLMNSIPGYFGEYSIYLNGAPYWENIQVMSPNYYQYVMIKREPVVELVLEIDQPHWIGVDQLPILSDADLQFNNFFLMRLVCFLMFGLLLFAYVILPFTYNVFNREKLRSYAIVGFLGMLVFVLETLWFYGVLDVVQRAVSLITLRYLRVFAEAWLIFCACRFAQKIYGAAFFRQQSGVLLGIYVACTAAALAFALLEFPVLWSELSMALCAVPALLLTAAMSLRSVLRWGGRALPSGIGILALLTGVLFKRLCPYAETDLPFQMVLPLGLLICLVCWALLIAESRRADIRALEKALTVEQTMAKTQAAFLASQIQPHFLYNTLTTIQELCYTDPMGAAETVVRFSNYLRQNIDFMDYKDKIPFTVELEHIDNYIEIQRTRFGDAVRFVREIGFSDFLLPPLTVQPLIENAVSHGIRKNNGQGTVSLVTKRLGREVRITVEDDGEGFDAETVHAHSLENIRCRIEGAMDGVVEIDSRPGRGAKITIRFPYKEAVDREDRHR